MTKPQRTVEEIRAFVDEMRFIALGHLAHMTLETASFLIGKYDGKFEMAKTILNFIDGKEDGKHE